MSSRETWVTHRLQLIPATVALCEAEMRGRAAVSLVLQAAMPQQWPPPVFEPDDVARVHRQLTAAPSDSEWTLYYIVERPVGGAERPALIGIAGYVSPPTLDGVIEIGYAIATEHQRRGYATEAVAALLTRAFADSRVRVVVATTYSTLLPSIRVLQKTGFVEVTRDPATNLVKFECRAPSARFTR
jgi:[ribosomal protein S5]-alanine N-acetyltransferase